MPLDDLPRLFRLSSVGSQSRDGTSLRRRAAAGEFVKVHAGVYVSSDDWHRESARRRHLIRLHAAIARLAPRVVVSHLSAAAVHDVARLGDWPEGIHVVDPARTTAQVASGVHRHAGPLHPGDVQVVGDLRVTAPARTAADLALASSFRDGVIALDDVLHRELASRHEIGDALDARPSARGRVGALRALRFADAGAGSPGESWCRVLLARVGAPVPVLQKAFGWGDGGLFTDYVDFWFPDCGVVLEFDGLAKYSNPRWRRGRTAEQIVVDEKIREDRIRNRPEVHGFARTIWSHLADPRLLVAELTRAGVPLASRRTTS